MFCRESNIPIHQISSRRGDKHFLYGRSPDKVAATKFLANDNVLNYLTVLCTSYTVLHRNAPPTYLLLSAAEQLHGIQHVSIPVGIQLKLDHQKGSESYLYDCRTVIDVESS